MVGIELVTDRKEKTPAKAETAILFEKLKGNKAQPPNTLNIEKISLWLWNDFLIDFYFVFIITGSWVQSLAS